MKEDIKSELRQRLSRDAQVTSPQEETFEASNLRFTEYERPVRPLSNERCCLCL